MWTLHGYFARELLKTFLMTATTLTLLIVMGGGVANMFQAEGIGAREMARIFIYLTPVAITLILPVAALFSATITYGRAANDNEILACSAAGINIHRLLLMPFALGLLVTGSTYFSWNYLIPYLTGEIEAITRRDLPSIVIGQFLKGKALTYGKYRIAAEHCETVRPSQLEGAADTGHTYLLLKGVSFIEIDAQELARLGTAAETIIDFDISRATPRVTVELRQVRTYDASRHQYLESADQTLGPIDVPMPIRRKIKFETLARLREFSDDPGAIPEIQDLMHGMRREMMSFFLNESLREAMDPATGTGTYTFVSPQNQIKIVALQFITDPEDGRVTLQDVTATVSHADRPGVNDVYTAKRALISLRSGLDRERPHIEIELFEDVAVRREPAGPDDSVVRKPKEVLPRVDFHDQPDMMKRFGAFDQNVASLYDDSLELPLYEKQERARQKVAERVQRYKSEVLGEIHFRSSYSLVTVAVVLLGALLGIIVRGGQVLTAFGISCVPLLIVIIASIVGRNLADRPNQADVGLMVMWGATVFMYVATWVVAFRVLRR